MTSPLEKNNSEQVFGLIRGSGISTLHLRRRHCYHGVNCHQKPKLPTSVISKYTQPVELLSVCSSQAENLAQLDPNKTFNFMVDSLRNSLAIWV